MKFVLTTDLPSLFAFSNHPKTFWITISPGEKIETLFFPTSSSYI